MAHLAVLAFDEGEVDPTGWDVGAEADGRHALPKVFGRAYDFCLAGFGAIAFDGYANFQLIYSLLRDLPVYLCQISSRMLIFRVKQFFDEPCLIGEKQSTLAIVVEATGGIHIGGKSKFIKSPMPGFGGELAEHAVRFIE